MFGMTEELSMITSIRVTRSFMNEFCSVGPGSYHFVDMAAGIQCSVLRHNRSVAKCCQQPLLWVMKWDNGTDQLNEIYWSLTCSGGHYFWIFHRGRISYMKLRPWCEVNGFTQLLTVEQREPGSLRANDRWWLPHIPEHVMVPYAKLIDWQSYLGVQTVKIGPDIKTSNTAVSLDVKNRGWLQLEHLKYICYHKTDFITLKPRQFRAGNSC